MYVSYKPTGGLNLKADSTAIPDGSLTVCKFCGFDTVGAITSSRGRRYINNGSALGGSNSQLGGFDGLASAVRYRWLKRGAAVYTGSFTDSTTATATFTTSVGTLAPVFKGGTAPTFSSTALLSGFAYNGYGYMADGTGMGRWKITGTGPLTGEMQTWGLRSPGYQEVTADASLSTNNSTTTTLTVTGGHGYGYGMADNPSYPYTMNVEFVGFKTLGGIPENQINKLHYPGTGSANDGDILVTSSGGTLNTGATYTITFRNGAGSYNWPGINIPNAYNTLVGGNISQSTVTQGSSSDPVTDEVQQLVFTGTVTSGNYRLKVSNGAGTNETTGDIAYNATAAQVQAALEALSFFEPTMLTGAAASVISHTAITITTTTASSGSPSPGGGVAGFIRQGPTLTVSTGDGGLVAGTYYYAYTFYNGVAESNFSAQVPVTVSTGDSVDLSNILMGPKGTTERRIYRTDVNGRQLYYIGVISDNTTTTYTDTAKLAAGADYSANPGDDVVDAENPAASADQQARKKWSSKRGIKEAEAAAKAKQDKLRERLATNLGLLSDWTDHDPPPTDLREVGLIGDTVFGISGSALRFSASGQPEHFPLSNSITPGRNTSETLKAWMAFDRDCIMYTDTGLYRLSQVGLDFSDSRFEEIESPVGCVGTRAVAALDGQQGHLFLAKTGIYLFDGARVNEVSYALEPLFFDSTHEDYINPAYVSSALMATSRDRVFLTYATTNTGNNRTLVGDFQDPADPKWTVLEWGFTALWRDKTDNSLLAGDSSGYVWELDYGYADGAAGGNTIPWELETKEFPLNGGKAFKVDEVVLDADFDGVSTTVTVSTRGRGVAKSCTFTPSTDGRQRVKLKCPTYLKGEVAKIYITSTSDTKRVLYGYGFTFLPIGQPMDEP